MIQRNMSLTGDASNQLNVTQRIGTAIGLGGLFILLLAAFKVSLQPQGLWLTIGLVTIAIGVFLFTRGTYEGKLEGIKNHGVFIKSISSRGLWGWIAALFLTAFYIILYFKPEFLGLGQAADGTNTGLVGLFDPLSQLLAGRDASQWFVYGVLYTLAIFAFGYKFMMKYKHNRYQQLRTASVMFFQLGFAFLIPEFLYRLNEDVPYYNLANMWPLNYYNFDQYRINDFLSIGEANTGYIGIVLLAFGILSIFVISPFLTYKYGKRWYCSWVCGCGGLAETAGDSFRQLSSKKMSAWKLERWLIHAVLVFSVIMTIGVVSTYLKAGYWIEIDGEKVQRFYKLTNETFLISSGLFLTLIFAGVMFFKRNELGKDARYGAIGYAIVIIALIAIHFTGTTEEIFFIKSGTLRSTYGVYIGSIFSGVIGTGFYPILGNRAWCRFGCPMASILGFQQRMFSKFRITTNGGQCISCGNCSTYCEMGIDVRAYAQKGENIVRSSCVGCGICSAVCPRGVLKLENGSLDKRIDGKQVLLGNDVDLMNYVNGQ